MGIFDEMPPQQELTFPVVLPDGSTVYCGVDEAGRIDPRKAYEPWLRRVTRYQTGTDRED